MEKPNRNWASKREKKAQRLEKISNLLNGKYVETEKIVEVMEKLIAPGDKVVLEGDNQKQASFLSESLEKVDAEKVNDLHLIMSSISRPEHLNIFEKGIASKIDFSYAGAQSLRVAQMIEDGTMKLGDIHTYLELYGRLFIDLIPNVVLVAADKADKDGNLYTGFNTEETPTIIEAAAFKDGIVIVQVNEVVDSLPRVGRRCRESRSTLSIRSFIHTRSSKHHRIANLNGNDGNQRNLRRTRRTIFESRYWIQYSSYRIVTANLWRITRVERENREELGIEPTSNDDSSHRIRLG